MIRITSTQLNRALSVASQTPRLSSLACLWGSRKDVSDEDCKISRYCEIVRFRKIFESDSPGFFGKFLELSEYQRIIQNYIGLEIEGGEYSQMRTIQIELRNLCIFACASILAIYPLFLANNETVPFLSLKEIKEIEENFSEEQFNQVGQEMQKINRIWFNQIEIILDNLAQPQRYKRAIFLLVKLFIQGVEKIQLPCLKEISEEEREVFFQEIIKTG